MNYAIIDAETSNLAHGEIPETKFWGFYDGTNYERFKKSRQLYKYLVKRKDDLVILHHSNFDVIQLLVDGIDDIQIMKSHNGRLIKSTICENHILLNSYSVFPVALAKIFKAFGRKKTSLKNLDKRNFEDCVWGLDCFLKLDRIFYDLVGVSPLVKGTIAGTGFQAAEMLAGKMPKDLRFLDSYRGGRTEVYDLRKYYCGKFDICSSYPYSFIDAPDVGELWHVKVKTKDWYCPFFDAKCNDLLLFPNGVFTSWVYRDNYERYIEPYAKQTKIKILSKHKIDLSWLKHVVPLIQNVYKMKLESEGAIQLAAKLLINAMYGRIGLRGESERARFLNYKPDGDDATAYKIGKRWLCFDKILRETRSNFPFAAYITDNARGRLYAAWSQAQTMYGDTDSAFVRGKFKEDLGEELGQWKFEGRKYFQARNVKDYKWGKEEIFKGGHGFTSWTLKRFAQGKSVERVSRERKTELRKRVVNNDGTTDPITVDNI